MNGLDTRIDGLVIDKSTAFQTICQTNNIIKPGIRGIHSYKGYRGYMYYKDRGYRGLSIYRPNSPISNTETLNVSHNDTRGYRAGYIKRYQTIPIGIYTPYTHILTYAGYKGLRLNGLINKIILWFFYFKMYDPVRVLTKPHNYKQ